MAFVEPIDVEEIADVLAGAFSERIAWQVDQSELDNRLDDAAHAAARILNRPYFEADLTDEEREAAQAQLASHFNQG